jgi:putative endonuclease
MGDQRQRAVRGREGEALVAERLESRGFRLVGRNVRVGRLELDIIAEHDGLLVFVEVRTRRAGALVHPAATVDRDKQARIRRAALGWLAGQHARPRAIRFDVAAVVASDHPSQPARLHYYPNAF